jgi:transcriptional regulator GlxA family with amidase domain
MKRVVLVLVPGVQSLDLTGPAEVFAAARRDGRPAYCLEFAAVGGGEVEASCGLRVSSKDLLQIRPRASDIVVVAGAPEPAIRAAVADQELLAWLRRAAGAVERMTSVCSGAFVLAAAGLLDGKRATTHWQGVEQLARMHPRVTVDGNAIFVRDGRIWTSAGVTTGIDMALAIVEEDLGRTVADAIAAALVLYVRRPGFQSQFSAALVAQTSSSDPLGAALSWARGHLARADVETLAKRAGLSVRTLHRRCLEHLGTTPAKLIDRLRIEHARTLLITSSLPAKVLAAQCGFGNSTRMKRVFQRELGIGPIEYRLLHAR